MKIGLVSPYSITKHGGVQEVILALQAGLTARGHVVKLITPKPRGVKAEAYPDVIFLGNSTDFRSPARTTTQVSSTHDVEEIDAMLAAEKFDVLHFHEPWNPLMSRQLLQRSTAVNIGTFHSQIPESTVTRTLVKTINPYIKSVINYLHVLTSVSKVGAEYYTQLTDQPFVIVPNGIDLAKYRRPAKIVADDRTILFVGRLERRKGLKYLLRAFRTFSQNHPDARLLIVGDGPERERLELLAEDLKLKNVEFLGYVSEERKVELLHQATLFCSPALFGESFGIVLLEAMAAGTVTIAGNNSGYVGVMRDEGGLSIVNPEDSDELVRRLELLMYNAKLREMWLKWAAGYVRQFDYPVVIRQYEELYEDALKQHGRPQA